MDRPPSSPATSEPNKRASVGHNEQQSVYVRDTEVSLYNNGGGQAKRCRKRRTMYSRILNTNTTVQFGDQ